MLYRNRFDGDYHPGKLSDGVFQTLKRECNVFENTVVKDIYQETKLLNQYVKTDVVAKSILKGIHNFKNLTSATKSKN